MDLDSRMFTIGTLVGAVLMVAAFAAYVCDPAQSYVLLFAIGFVLLIVGYALKLLENRKVRMAYMEAYEEGEDDGFTVVLDEDYVPFENMAYIEDIREQ